MVVEVLAAQVVHVGGADHRATHLPSDAGDAGICLVLVGDPVALELEVDVLGAEDPEQLVDVGAGLGRVVLHQAPAEARLQAAREGDHPAGVAGEQLEVDVGLAAAVALEEAGRAQLGQVAEALVAGGEQRQVVALVAHGLRSDVVDEVGLEAENRLDAVLGAGLVELQGTVHHPVVGEAERGLAELGGARGEGVDPAGAVEQRVLGVDVQVGAGGSRHGRRSVGPGPDGNGLSEAKAP